MKKTITLILAIALVVGGFYFLSGSTKDNGEEVVIEETTSTTPTIHPISHATFWLEWGDVIIYNDPVGGKEAFAGAPEANLILISDTHGDHLNIETLEAIVGNTPIIAPQAVADELPEVILGQTTVMANDDVVTQSGIQITALPMYNLPDQGVEIRHEKGRGNGYLLEKDGFRLYIAGDTAGIPEMRALSDIDVALVPMNLPYTMSVEDAADAVIEFAPEKVYPYHYRTPEGLSDVELFKTLVEEGNPDVEVVLDSRWYPES